MLGVNWASPTRIEKMTVSKMRMADLETSASGYSYNQQQGLPVSYVQYTNHGSNLYYDAPKPLQYVSTLQAPLQAHLPPPLHPIHAPGVVYANQGPGLPYAPQVPHLQPVEVPLVRPQVKAVAPYYDDKEVGENNNFEVYEDYRENADDDLGDDDVELHLDHEDHVLEEPHVGLYGYGHPGGLIGNDIPVSLGRYGDSHGGYEHNSGKDYQAEKHDVHGQEGEKGYKGYRQFDHGEKGEHSSDDQKG